jgi:DNA-directed RNA polymerase III subunit RPC6
LKDPETSKFQLPLSFSKTYKGFLYINRGIWTRDIKINTNISQNILTKTLKILEQRNLIKSVRSVVSKSKKLYMVYDMVPAKEITGGPWYSDQEFDHSFVDALGDIIVTIVKKGNIVDLPTIAQKVRISGVCKVRDKML